MKTKKIFFIPRLETPCAISCFIYYFISDQLLSVSLFHDLFIGPVDMCLCPIQYCPVLGCALAGRLFDRTHILAKWNCFFMCQRMVPLQSKDNTLAVCVASVSFCTIVCIRAKLLCVGAVFILVGYAEHGLEVLFIPQTSQCKQWFQWGKVD